MSVRSRRFSNEHRALLGGVLRPGVLRAGHVCVRLLRGPTAQDRVLALDTLYINGMLTMLVFGIRSGTSVYFDIALLIALFGFVGSTAMAVSCCAGGDRAMIESQIPLWAGIPASILLVLGGLLALTGSAGLLRFRSFYARIHAPTLGNTLGCGCVLASSMLVFRRCRRGRCFTRSSSRCC